MYGTKYQSCEKLYLIYPKDGDIKESLYHYFSENDSKDKKLPLEILFFDLENPSLDFLNRLLSLSQEKHI